ncbi:MAG: FAD-linked oxidase C-terminal domain-containing protein [Pseudohongiellaceae bacterium]
MDGTAEEVDQHINAVKDIFARHGASTLRVSASEAERELLWKGRKSAFPAVGRISADYYCMDGTIPRSQVSHVLEEIARLSAKYQLRCANVFHAGDGNLHPLIMFDGGCAEQIQRAEQFGAEILELSVAVGGCITGEHGVGLEKLAQMQSQFSTGVPV